MKESESIWKSLEKFEEIWKNLRELELIGKESEGTWENLEEFKKKLEESGTVARMWMDLNRKILWTETLKRFVRIWKILRKSEGILIDFLA